MARPGPPSRLEGVTPGGVDGVRFLDEGDGLLSPATIEVPDGPAPSLVRLFMYLAMPSASLTFVASRMRFMDSSFQAAALAGDILASRLRVIFSTMGASPRSAGGEIARLCEAMKMLRGCRFLLWVFEFGSIRRARGRQRGQARERPKRDARPTDGRTPATALEIEMHSISN